MNLGSDQNKILSMFFTNAKSTSEQWVEGANEIRTQINNINVTIRFYVNEGKLISLDGFTGYSSRIIGNLIQK